MKNKRREFLDQAVQYRDESITPLCRHFTECGGCLLQDVSYENQLLLKREYLNKLFTGMTEIECVKPSAPYRYRNRMDFVTAFNKSGLRRSGNYRHVVDIESCEIMQEKTNKLFQKVKPLLREVEDYDYLRHRGYLRYVVLRQGRFSGRTMVNFVTASKENRMDRIIDTIKDEADSISLLLSDGKADLSFGQVIIHIKGGTIEEKLGDKKFIIVPNSFFQSNSETALMMLERIKQEVHGTVLDLYAGLGSISLFVADKTEKIIGVEIQQEAVQTALRNRELNNIQNAEFFCCDALDFLKESETRYATVILDPPRNGLHPKVIKQLNISAPEKIIYMSCNPHSLKNDLSMLEGYSLRSIEAFDMFPQTPHIEMLAVLVKHGTT